jgi:hypothetical protein
MSIGPHGILDLPSSLNSMHEFLKSLHAKKWSMIPRQSSCEKCRVQNFR